MGNSISTTLANNQTHTSTATNQAPNSLDDSLSMSQAQSSIDAQFISDAKGFNITWTHPSNINDLPNPLVFIDTARHYLFVIHNELMEIGRTQKLNREKISDITTHLRDELKQAPIALSNYDDSMKELAQPLAQMAEQLHTDFYATAKTTSHIGFIDFFIQTLSILEQLDLVCETALNAKAEGK